MTPALSAVTPPAAKASSFCTNCTSSLEHDAKFCGGCGFIVAPSTFSIHQYPEQHARLISLEEADHRVPQALPAFARTGMPVENARNTELSNEANKIMLLLARERIFLYLHWLCFIGVNLFGCWVAMKCYGDFIGDEMSKMMIATTPFLFINSVALLFLVPIKGTRSEIASLKERLSCIRFNLEFGHLNI